MDAESLLLHVDYSIRQLREFANVSRALDGLECIHEATMGAPSSSSTPSDHPAPRRRSPAQSISRLKKLPIDQPRSTSRTPSHHCKPPALAPGLFRVQTSNGSFCGGGSFSRLRSSGLSPSNPDKFFSIVHAFSRMRISGLGTISSAGVR